MGRVILCAGAVAQNPYVLKTSGVKIYTIEELCYCLRKQLDMLDENIIDREMALFIKHELKFEERGELLEQLVLTKADLKSRLVVIFCTGDYFDEKEIKDICAELDELSSMSAIGRRKRRADKYMSEGYYRDALNEYRSVLGSGGAFELNDEAYGNILHNIGVIYVRSARYDLAAESFRKAYEKNASEETLKSYFFALKLGHRDKEYMSEAIRLLDSGDFLHKIELEMENAIEQIELSGEINQIDRLKVLYQQGRATEFDRLSDELITGLKANYRTAMME